MIALISFATDTCWYYPCFVVQGYEWLLWLAWFLCFLDCHQHGIPKAPSSGVSWEPGQNCHTKVRQFLVLIRQTEIGIECVQHQRTKIREREDTNPQYVFSMFGLFSCRLSCSVHNMLPDDPQVVVGMQPVKFLLKEAAIGLLALHDIFHGKLVKIEELKLLKEPCWTVFHVYGFPCDLFIDHRCLPKNQPHLFWIPRTETSKHHSSWGGFNHGFFGFEFNMPPGYF